MQLDILVTGGAGYIGSHTVIELIKANYNPIVIDNFSNSVKDHNNQAVSLRMVKEITGKNVEFYEIDLLDLVKLEILFKKHKFFAVIHLAGLKSVNESKLIPLKYYTVNVNGALNLLNTMVKYNVKNFIFSSSATVYGEPQYLPIDENHPTGQCVNAYGRTKYFIEEILKDTAQADSNWEVIILRYFNPIGADKSGKIGEDPLDIPNNLMPYVSRVAMGVYNNLNVFGNDYKTKDGTGVRDYIHVVDLAKGHVSALNKIIEDKKNSSHQAISNGGDACKPNLDNVKIYNLGVGHGCSVLELVNAFEKVSGRKIPYEFKSRRDGDVASCYANPNKAFKEMGWKATMDLTQMCEDSWNWQRNNPKGFSDKV